MNKSKARTMKAYLEEVMEIEKKLSKIIPDSHDDNYPKPLNSKEEKEKFFAALEKKRSVQPPIHLRKTIVQRCRYRETSQL